MLSESLKPSLAALDSIEDGGPPNTRPLHYPRHYVSFSHAREVLRTNSKKGGSSLRKTIGMVLIILVLLTACTKKIDFVDEGPFVKLELYSASTGTYLDHFPKIITVSNDGNIHVFTEEVVTQDGEVELKVGEDAPTIKKEISAQEVKEIKQVIEKNRFFSIPENVTDYSVMDGVGSRITVYEKEQKRKVGGENSSNKRYNAIEDILFEQVKDEYDAWEKETADYLSKRNE